MGRGSPDRRARSRSDRSPDRGRGRDDRRGRGGSPDRRGGYNYDRDDRRGENRRGEDRRGGRARDDSRDRGRERDRGRDRGYDRGRDRDRDRDRGVGGDSGRRGPRSRSPRRTSPAPRGGNDRGDKGGGSEKAEPEKKKRGWSDEPASTAAGGAVPDWLKDLVPGGAGAAPAPDVGPLGHGGVVNVLEGEWLCPKCKWRNYKPKKPGLVTCVQCHTPRPLELPLGLPGLATPGLIKAEQPKGPPSALVAANMMGQTTPLNQLFAGKTGAKAGPSLLDTSIAKGAVPAAGPPKANPADVVQKMKEMLKAMGKIGGKQATPAAPVEMIPSMPAKHPGKGKGKGKGKNLPMPMNPGILPPPLQPGLITANPMPDESTGSFAKAPVQASESPPATVAKAPMQASESAPATVAKAPAPAPAQASGWAGVDKSRFSGPSGPVSGDSSASGGGSNDAAAPEPVPEHKNEVQKTIEKQQEEIEKLRDSLFGSLTATKVVKASSLAGPSSKDKDKEKEAWAP